MTSKSKTVLFLGVAAAVAGGALFLSQAAGAKPHVVANPPAPPKPPVVSKKERVQVALLIDTSSSMDGLINQARQEMWSLVNELATSTRNGSLPTLEIAVYEYGKATLDPDTGFIRQLSPFTTSLDGVSEALFALETNGGDEFAGQVIQTAAKDLAWDKDESTLKIMFIAGNEEFTQGPVDYKDAIASAKERGITVNTIYCGSPQASDAAGWAAGAKFAAGEALTIDQNAQIAHAPAPQDLEIARLGALMNSTYVAYGAGGMAGRTKQAQADAKAASSPRASLERSKSKASMLYKNTGWDLVDKLEADGDAALDDLEEAELPSEMRAMNKEERKVHVREAAKKRADLQAQIKDLNAKRDAYLAAQPAAPAAEPAGGPTLDKALLNTVRNQAGKKGYSFKK